MQRIFELNKFWFYFWKVKKKTFFQFSESETFEIEKKNYWIFWKPKEFSKFSFIFKLNLFRLDFSEERKTLIHSNFSFENLKNSENERKCFFNFFESCFFFWKIILSNIFKLNWIKFRKKSISQKNWKRNPNVIKDHIRWANGSQLRELWAHTELHLTESRAFMPFYERMNMRAELITRGYW